MTHVNPIPTAQASFLCLNNRWGQVSDMGLFNSYGSSANQYQHASEQQFPRIDWGKGMLRKSPHGGCAILI